MSTETNLAATHPVAYRTDLLTLGTEWVGRRVAVRYIRHRGSYHRRTIMGWAWGVLVAAEQTQHVAVRERDGRVRNIHYKRVTAMYDLSRRLDPTRSPAPAGRSDDDRDPGVPVSMEPGRAYRLDRARGASTQWEAMRELARAYND